MFHMSYQYLILAKSLGFRYFYYSFIIGEYTEVNVAWGRNTTRGGAESLKHPPRLKAYQNLVQCMSSFPKFQTLLNSFQKWTFIDNIK